MPARILVVEDNVANLELMSYLLRAEGHVPTTAGDGMAGLQVALRDEFDLILSDILMPRLDGYELVRRLRSDAKLSKTKIVAVTALAMVGDRERILGAGFDGYLAKPIDPETFVRDVEMFLPPDRRSRGPAQAAAAPAPLPEIAPRGPAILVVDDVAVNREVIRGALDPLGYRIVEARNVAEARVKLRESDPQLILCDVHMPGGTGFEFASEIKKDPAYMSVPFLFISSTVWRAADRKRAAELGAGDLILRPIDPQRLQSEVRRMLAARDSGSET